MNRELKFRVWDHTTKQFDGVIYKAGEQFGHPSCCDWVAQQFTGICDKNGREIYEGDIVKCPVTLHKHIHGDFSIRVVKWNNEIFTWVLDGRWSWMTFNGAFGDDADFMDYNDDGYGTPTVEVIGNIFDNPELKKEYE